LWEGVVWVGQVASAISGHVWLALWYPVSVVLNALARAVARVFNERARSRAEEIRTSTTIASIKAEDELLKDLDFSATVRRKRAIERLDRDRTSP
jgi:hypothetical protein